MMISIASIVLGLLQQTPASPSAQNVDKAHSIGSFGAAFNHQVPDAWKKGQPGWDGEPDSPYRFVDAPPRFMAAHMSLIPRGPFQGQILTWTRVRTMLGLQYWAIIDPVSKSFQNFAIPTADGEENFFCSGHAWTKDGDLLVAGGSKIINGWMSASSKVYRFVPVADAGNAMWVQETDLAIPRWYPTVTAIGSNSQGEDLMLVIGGTRDTKGRKPFKSYEAFIPSSSNAPGHWQINPNAPGSTIFSGPRIPRRAYQFGFYPRTSLLSDGSLFFSGMAGLSYRLWHADMKKGSPPRWEIQPQNPFVTHVYACTVLLPNLGGPSGGRNDIVLRTAGSDVTVRNHIPQAPPYLEGPPYAAPSSRTDWIQATSSQPKETWAWRTAGPLTFKRARADATLLPDGTVLVSGGKQDTEIEINCGVPVLQAELFDPLSMTWRTDANARIRRGYHSAAVLLPDARVLIGGGEAREMDYEIYRPPYLTEELPRPEILGQAAQGEAWNWSYGASVKVPFQLDPKTKIKRCVLIAPASVTHHFDSHQRYVELAWRPEGIHTDAQGNTSLAVLTPADSNHAPRGYYMLFLVTEAQPGSSAGVPSEAAWVKLH